MIESKTEKSSERPNPKERYYITSISLNAATIARALRALRAHWGNPLHWALDVQMSKDNSRMGARYAAETTARIRRHTNFLLKGYKPREKRTSIEKKRTTFLL